jgi:hypothetical protein
MKNTAVALSAVALLAAGCGQQQAGRHTAGHAAAARDVGTTHSSARQVAAASPRVAALAATAPARCPLSRLAVRLGPAGHAAGSTYRPIVFTNTGTTACSLTGYPGVSYVAPKTGRQVGAAADRDRTGKVNTVTLAPGRRAAALLQLVNPFNYPASDCTAKTVSGLRVYPPGSTGAAYVAFAHRTKVCSTKVRQLSVRAVVRGRTGQ